MKIIKQKNQEALLKLKIRPTGFLTSLSLKIRPTGFLTSLSLSVKLLAPWGRGSQEQSCLPRSRWTNSTQCLAALSVTMGPALNGESLTEPIDIYSEYIDECERVNNVDDEGVPVEDDVD
ncbi:hypothetical protein R6Q59_006309 [Mikania micrantha]